MFTGIVSAVGRVRAVRQSSEGLELDLDAQYVVKNAPCQVILSRSPMGASA